MSDPQPALPFWQRAAVSRGKHFDPVEAIPGQEVCDFCSRVPVHWQYPCRSFMFPDRKRMLDGSEGDWAACDVCHELIEADDRSGLLRRVVDCVIEDAVAHGLGDQLVPRHEIVRDTRIVQRRFFEHRTGPAEPYTP